MNKIIEIQKEVQVGNIILEKGDKIEILKENDVANLQDAKNRIAKICKEMEDYEFSVLTDEDVYLDKYMKKLQFGSGSLPNHELFTSDFNKIKEMKELSDLVQKLKCNLFYSDRYASFCIET